MKKETCTIIDIKTGKNRKVKKSQKLKHSSPSRPGLKEFIHFRVRELVRLGYFDK